MTTQILWRRIDTPGHEACRVFSCKKEWHLAGTTVFAHDHQTCRLDYSVICDADWNTLSGRVSGWLGNKTIDIDIAVAADHSWKLNGVECPAVLGCTDLDLNFSPSTNLLPIRRLNLDIGQKAEVKAAWLRFPSFELEPLPQVYRRLGESTFRYESAGGSFVADLEVDASGFVTNYPDLWKAEVTS